MDAILNISKRSMMPAGHHSDSDSTLLPLPKSAITWLGGIFARLPPLAARLLGRMRSSRQHLLVVPQAKLVSLRDRTFTVVGPRLWNALPIAIKRIETIPSFIKALKTHNLYRIIMLTF